MTGYRASSLRCPRCGALLEAAGAGEAIVDVCPGCGGVWVDWFDGDLAAVMKQAPTLIPGEARGQGGNQACPRCQCALAWETYLETGAELLRCGECAGAFVPQSSLDALQKASEPAGEQGNFWKRLRAILKSLPGFGA